MEKDDKNIVINREKKNLIFVTILFVAIIIAILFWKTENIGEDLEEAQIKIISLKNDVSVKLDEIDSLYHKNKILADQYRALRSNYIRLQNIIVRRRNTLSAVSPHTAKSELTDFIEQLNRQIMQYEEVFEELEKATDESITGKQNKRLLAENERLSKQLQAATLNSSVLQKEKQLLDQRINALQARLKELGKETGEQDEFLAQLQEKMDKKQQEIQQIKAEKEKKEQQLEEKEEAISDLQQDVKAIDEITENSFSATYKWKEGRRRQKTSQLNNTDLHKRRFVRTVDVKFMIGDTDSISTAYLSLFKLNEDQEKYEPYRYDKMPVELENFRGKAQLNIDPKFDKGVYYFLVTQNSEQVFKHTFVIK